MPSSIPSGPLQRAAAWLRDADALVIAAGAGMGVDSGLPDFRGNEGFWRAYPALARARLDFTEVASPATFESDPELAWGFYGHRLSLYRQAQPHEGFALLRAMAERMRFGAFVFTSNVDGQFQAAGFDEGKVHECHGSIHWLQCTGPCAAELWPADELQATVDVDSCRWLLALPTCRRCGGLARPNVLMFGDGRWVSHRSDLQHERLRRWLHAPQRPVVLEIGAGVRVPSVRRFGEYLIQAGPARLVRINPRDAQVHSGQAVGLAVGALAGLRALHEAL